MKAPMSTLVVNASPLIHLAEAGFLDLLRDQGSAVWVPEPVAKEVRAYGPTDPTAGALAAYAWLEVQPAIPIPEAILAWDLGPGESSVLALAYGWPDRVAVIDDLAGRRCAAALGVRLKGTVGLVLAARVSGRLTAARPALERLRDSGMFLSDAVLDRALRQVGE